MALNKDLAERIRAVLAGTGSLREVRMFGGLCFMLNGNMVAGTSKRGLLVRVGRGQHARALARADAKPMEMSGRPMEGYVLVDPPPRDERTLRDWLDLAAAFVNTLPPKPPRSKPPAPADKAV
jgi:TfoX/Sxy family transcriptional regulator of competence genes